MVTYTSGLLPSEFDDTINRVCRTIAASGTTDVEIEEDMTFLTDLLGQIGSTDTSIPMEETTWVLDVAFIGLLYHRHMPWLDEEGNVARPERLGPADYTLTLTALSNALIREKGLSKAKIQLTAMLACTRVLNSLEPKPGLPGDHPDMTLHRQWLALTSIGILVHKYLPGTDEEPPRKE